MLLLLTLEFQVHVNDSQLHCLVLQNCRGLSLLELSGGCASLGQDRAQGCWKLVVLTEPWPWGSTWSPTLKTFTEDNQHPVNRSTLQVFHWLVNIHCEHQ
ncbi:hypothetical protein Q7C36_004883 [Tachysurus vachellii]|uniref:Uncharacterized protein n=1 Tax=Tachysurus vachellii TaxID=175792 RepID=A0AA88T4H6_TACVA|nr:hypothetical protein Q7C36_004883 [Tachysurus vachellii]